MSSEQSKTFYVNINNNKDFKFYLGYSYKFATSPNHFLD